MERSQRAAQNSGDECPYCGGTGWVTYTINEEGYGEVEYARKCTCTGAFPSDRTGVPPQFHDAELSKFGFGSYSTNMDKLKKLITSFFGDFEEWQGSNKGLYIWSRTPGSGKTFLSCCIAKSVMMRYGLRMRFTTTPDYLSVVVESYKRERGAMDESWIYRDCELLVLDDIGTQKSGEWQEQELFRLINDRMNNGKITIFTSNFPPEGLKLDARIIDRIIKASVVIQMPEEGIRRNEATREQQRFLEKILAK